MKVTKQKNHYLLKNNSGEYHFSHKEYERLGRAESIKIAEKEINKKLKSKLKGKTINFEQARDLGFCALGLKDFCKELEIDITKEYKIEYLNKKLTLRALKEYPDECIKVFGKNTLKYLGGVKGVLCLDTIELVLRPEFIPEKSLHKLACKFARSVLHIFENEYPSDDRPRKAIEAKEAWIKGDIGDAELKSASIWASASASASASAWASASASASVSASASAWESAWSSASAWSRAREKEKQVEMILLEIKNSS